MKYKVYREISMTSQSKFRFIMGTLVVFCVQGVFGLAPTTTVSLNFSATIKADMCAVDASSSTVAFPFGDIVGIDGSSPNSAVAGVPPKAESIVLKCSSDPTGKLNISFSNPSKAIDVKNILPLSVSGSDSGLGVRLYNSDGDVSGTALDLTLATVSKGTWSSAATTYTIPLTAELVYDSASSKIVGGSAVASIILNESSA